MSRESLPDRKKTVKEIDVETGSIFSATDEWGYRTEYMLRRVKTPEKGEEGFDEAKNVLTKLIGNTATIFFNPTHRGSLTEMHMVSAITEDGININERMQANGY